MAVHREWARDGITGEERIHVGAATSPAELRKDLKAIEALVAEYNQLATFNGRIADLERTCLRTPGRREGPDQPQPEFGSRARYAEDILATIQAVRTALGRSDADLAASEAVLLGALAAEAEAKFHWGSRLLHDARMAKNRELSLRSALARRQAGAERDAAIATAARDYRTRHPEHSVRSMAASIAGPLDMKPGTVRDRLGKLGIR